MRPVTNKKNKKNILIFAVIVTFFLVIGMGIWYLKSSAPAAPNDSSSLTDDKNNNTSGGGITSPKESPNQPTPSPDNDVAPIKPSGTFVSNHRPNLSGSPAPNTISSTCTTTPGSECTVEFTRNGVTKSLPKKTADSNGNVSWDWKLQDIGLTAGEWQIRAVANNGDKFVEASDSMPFMVGE